MSLAYTGTGWFVAFFVRRTPFPFTIAYFAELVCHDTPESTSCEPSLNVPIAVNWIFERGGAIGFGGVMLMDTNVAVVTFSVAEPLTLPYEAVMVVVPALSPLAKPPALIRAKLALEELHTA